MFFSNEVTEKRIIHYWPDIEKKKLVYAGYIDSASVSTTSKWPIISSYLITYLIKQRDDMLKNAQVYVLEWRL